ncbi:DUF2231 domain-containing protein [Amycolatopsis sp. A133]|uniref:DUF2231 domain-containing protein n=1 Tax=Amycolatopsis sp. A133 TaxID=3064472 RepID=UPI0027F2803E|nr:DUF2231 domain-containing protein [Amycolatopsis sp. A133]MDQ7805443.1 DUF2231 domain-containing protein [Amycolatopsis sp. A133]
MQRAHPSETPAPPHRALTAVEEAAVLDAPATALVEKLRGAAGSVPGRLLRGRWLGHPLHPLVVTVPIGAWLCSALFDLVPGQEEAARRLVATGLLAAPAAVLLGLFDYADLDERQRRVGLAHAAGNAVAIALFGASYTARKRGQVARGRVLGALGLAMTSAGGALGGHLAYAQGAGVFRWQSAR